MDIGKPRLMLVMDNVALEMAVDAMMPVFDEAARRALDNQRPCHGFAIGQRYVIDSENNMTKTIVWDVIDVHPLA